MEYVHRRKKASVAFCFEMFVNVLVTSSVLAGCVPNPCLHGGTCTDAVYSEDVVCACAPVWDGPICSKHFHYLGCFEDKALRVLPVRYPDSTSNSPLECASRCHSYIVAGVEIGKQCFCGNVWPDVRKPESECNYVCPGNSTMKCGGDWRINVYSD
ncbi:hypothetical protein DPMN_087196 [Dreissena polymorpha]|uniref:WSC domain-containing protein n=1 Tax=Dreissena polymorpha TaxID=45954 RepID=A0A9D4KSC4_DREPO|nr:hypothetical protein DPMN_087196 [Dreissena polymorpha]